MRFALSSDHEALRALTLPFGVALVTIGLVALLLRMDFLTALGLGLPAVVAGVALSLCSWIAGRAKVRAAAAVAIAVVLIHGGWMAACVLAAGGKPSMLLWVLRLVGIALLLRVAARSGREEGTHADSTATVNHGS